MKILSIETSCDETGVTVLESDGDTLRVRGNALASQIELHAQYGGVFPMMAKRAHAEKIVLLMKEALEQAGMIHMKTSLATEPLSKVGDEIKKEIEELCAHEQGLAEQLVSFAEDHIAPDIDCIAVTSGPGLEPALWVGINTATALGKLWNKPVYPINHMEGHIVASILRQVDSSPVYKVEELPYPALSLLVSGGHTELVLMEGPLSYKKIGQTKDDAVGEAFDKVARILGLPYPGGPKISALALEARTANLESSFTLPRPMLHSKDYDFSYSGLKTAVLYLVRDLEKQHYDILQNDKMKKMIAREFEEAAIEVLVTKTKRAIEEYNVQTLIVGGGVAANTYLREQLGSLAETLAKAGRPITLLFPAKDLSTDNSVMIGMALYYQLLHGNKKTAGTIRADGNLSI